MAITLVGTAKVGTALDGGNVTLTFDTGGDAPQEGDVVVLWGGHADNTLGGSAGPVTSGYTEFKAPIHLTNVSIGAWHKVMGATPDLTVVGAGDASTRHAVLYGCYVLRGVDTTTPSDATPTDITQTTGTVDSPAITTVTNGAWVIPFFLRESSNTGPAAAPTGYSNLLSDGLIDTDRVSGGSATKEVATAGSEDPSDWGVTPSTQSSAWTLAIRPAAGGGATNLVIQDATHAHAADNIALTQAHNLVVADAGHGHTADAFALTQVHNLAVQEAAHAHTADNVVLEAGGATNLIIQDAAHGHSADNVALTQAHNLTISEAAHAHVADSLTLGQIHNLAVGDALHAHSADNIALTQVHNLVVGDALHGHTADNLDLAGGASLTIQDGLHAHTADGLALSQVHELQVDEALHVHTADSPTFTQDHVLVIDDSGHVHLADNVVVTTPSQDFPEWPVSVGAGWEVGVGAGWPVGSGGEWE